MSKYICTICDEYGWFSHYEVYFSEKEAKEAVDKANARCSWLRQYSEYDEVIWF